MSDTPPESSSSGGPKMPAALSKKYGSFSLGVWLLILAGGVAAGLLIRKLTASFGQAPAADLSTTAPTDESLFTTPGYSPNNVIPINGGPGGTGQNMPADATTNDAWQSRALTFLIGRGFDAAEADTALRKYMYGDPVTPKEAAMVSVALAYMGAPPEPVEPLSIDTSPTTPVPVPTVDPPPPPPTSTPVQPTYVPPPPAPAVPDARQAWLTKAKEVADAANAGHADPQAMVYMGFTSHDENLTPITRFYYRKWLDANGYEGQLA